MGHPHHFCTVTENSLHWLAASELRRVPASAVQAAFRTGQKTGDIIKPNEEATKVLSLGLLNLRSPAFEKQTHSPHSDPPITQQNPWKNRWSSTVSSSSGWRNLCWTRLQPATDTTCPLLAGEYVRWKRHQLKDSCSPPGKWPFLVLLTSPCTAKLENLCPTCKESQDMNGQQSHLQSHPQALLAAEADDVDSGLQTPGQACIT